jgi:hypothetical protein
MYTKNFIIPLLFSFKTTKSIRTSLNIIFFLCICNFRLLAQTEIILNTTGYGFNKDEANGINSEQWEYIQKFTNLTYNGEDASVSAIRLHIEWNQYEPTPGNYQRAKIVAAVKAITELKPGMKFALHFPFNRPGYWNDSYFEAGDIAQTRDGSLIQSNIAYTCPSLYSEYAQNRFYAFVDDVMTQIKAYYPRLLYVQMGNSPAEELAVPFNSSSPTLDPGLYEQKALEAWRKKFLPLRFPNKTKATWDGAEYDINTAYQPTDGNYYNSERGRDLHRFAGWGLLKKFEGFYRVVKKHSKSIKVLYFISDFGTQQGNISFLHNSTLPLALELADGIYSSDGTTEWDLHKKILVADVIKGTDKNKIAAIEFDPEDLGQPRGSRGINGAIPAEWFPRAYKHGADYIHIAMNFSDLEIAQLAYTLADVKKNYVKRNYQPPAREEAVPINIAPAVFTDQYLFQSYINSAGTNWSVTDKKPQSIKMLDDGYWENLWDNSPNVLPCTFSINATAPEKSPAGGTKTKLSVTCQGDECNNVKYTWNGEGIVSGTGSTVEIEVPKNAGNYVYTVKTSRSGCRSKSATTSLAIGNPLPVTLAGFTAKKVEKTVLLDWNTSEEMNSDRFEVEHSLDGKNWSVAGTVQAKGEAKQILSKYSFTDHQPESGENLYRLKMIDLDDTYAYSRILSIIFEDESSVIAYPNPTTDKLTISNSEWSKIDKVQILNLTGTVIMESDNKAGPEINVITLTPGSYFIRFVRKDGLPLIQKFVKRG